MYPHWVEEKELPRILPKVLAICSCPCHSKGNQDEAIYREAFQTIFSTQEGAAR